MKRRTALTLTAGAGLGVLTSWAIGSSAVAPALAADAAKPVVYREFVLGNPKSKVTVIEYASLTCPHCAHFQEVEYPKLKKNYIDNGKIKYVYRDYPLDGLAMGAALIARCAPGDRGATLIDMMFKNQRDWAGSEKPIEALRGYALLAGMTSPEVDACLKNEAILKDIQDVQQKATTLYKVDATPTFFVNEEKVKGADYDALAAVIDKALK